MTNAELLWLAVWAGTVLLLIMGWVVRRRREAKTRVEEEIPAEIPRDQLALYIDYSAEKDRLNPRPVPLSNRQRPVGSR